MNQTDPNIFGGELGAAIVRYYELAEQDKEARTRLEKAGQTVKTAEARGIAQAAAARAAGEADPSDAAESEAKAELELAQREAQIAAAAVRHQGNTVADEAGRNGEKYKAKLSKREEAARKTGLNALAKLEEALHEIRLTRGYIAWLDRTGEGPNLRVPQTGELISGTTIIRTANGEPVAASSLTASLHEVLDPPSHRQGDQRAPWGIPVGAVQTENYPPTGPATISGQAARVFAEQAGA